jgi:hypothetical protein
MMESLGCNYVDTPVSDLQLDALDSGNVTRVTDMGGYFRAEFQKEDSQLSGHQRIDHLFLAWMNWNSALQNGYATINNKHSWTAKPSNCWWNSGMMETSVLPGSSTNLVSKRVTLARTPPDQLFILDYMWYIYKKWSLFSTAI